jgi:outer membrane protein OmpA-like peptidoglycan-associated protein
VAPLAFAQGYEPPTRANPNDVYCSGFIAANDYPRELYVIGGWDAAGRLTYSRYDYVYLNRGADGGLQAGQRYTVVRRYDQEFNDWDPVEAFPRQKEMLKAMGKIHIDVGQVEVVAVNPDTSTALVTSACGPLQMGDVLIPFQERPIPEYRPANGFDRFAAPTGPEGTVVLGKDFQYQMGQGDVAYTDLGSGDGIKVGDYLRFYRYGRGTEYMGYKHVVRGQWRHYYGVPRWTHPIPIDTKIRNRLPRELIGEGMVVHTEANSSTVLVTLSLTEIHAGDFAEMQPPTPPKADITVVPARITRGELATLSWSTASANQIEITPSIGAVKRRGTRTITPTQSTTFRITASGPGGSAEDSASITVVEPPEPPPPPPPPPQMPALEDIFFDFNRADIRPDAAATLNRVAAILKQFPNARVRIEGHCDEVGSDEYNNLLGQRRADATLNALVQMGVNPNQLTAISMGRSQQFCAESMEESCRQLNRRAHFVSER